MPLNVPKTYTFVPNPVGPVHLFTRSARRSRLWKGGTYFRSIERGGQANQIKIACVEDLSDHAHPEGLLVVQHTVLAPSESLFVANMSMPQIELLDLKINWDEEVRVTLESGALVARIIGIRWQIAGGETVRAELGVVTPGRIFSAPGHVSFKLQPGTWPSNGVLYIRPRTHRYHLVHTSDTDTESSVVSTGWSIESLRATLNGSDNWVRMPKRGKVQSSGAGAGGEPRSAGGTSSVAPSAHSNEDRLDPGLDEEFLTKFDLTPMAGGDGLPANPVGMNTGPDRVLVHLNYSELDNGSLGLLNQVFEWVGSSATVGSWQRYS